MWFVIHEYETYNNEEPVHAWTVLDRKKTKKEAEEAAVELNYKYYCENFPERYPELNKKSAPKNKIVKYVLNNINSKTGSENGKFGTGIWIIDASKYNLNEKQTYFTNLDPQPTPANVVKNRDKDDDGDHDSVSSEDDKASVYSNESGLISSEDDSDG